jgi:hypothetical protein
VGMCIKLLDKDYSICKLKEAIKEIIENKEHYDLYYDFGIDVVFLKQALDELARLQEKETRVKPIEISHEEGVNTYRLYHCPKCLNDEIDLYCNVCGQKIDWSEENE